MGGIRSIVLLDILWHECGPKFHAFIAKRNMSHSPNFARSCKLFFSRQCSREIHVLTSWAFPGRFDRVVNTSLRFLKLPACVGPIVRNDGLNCCTQLRRSYCPSEFRLCYTCLFLPWISSVEKCLWHDRRWVFRRLLLIGFWCRVPYPLVVIVLSSTVLTPMKKKNGTQATTRVFQNG